MVTVGPRTVGLGASGRDGVLVGGAANNAPNASAAPPKQEAPKADPAAGRGAQDARFRDQIDLSRKQLAEGLGRLDSAIEQATAQLAASPSPQAGAQLANILFGVTQEVRGAFPGETRSHKKLDGYAQEAGALVNRSADPKARAKLEALAESARAELDVLGGKIGGYSADAKGVDKGMFDAYVQSVLGQMGVPPNAPRPSFQDINAAYDPRMAVPPGAQNIGGMQMPPYMMPPGAPPPGPMSSGGIVENPTSGLGTAAMVGAAAALLLGYPTYGGGMGWPGSQLGLGGFNWWVY